MAAAGPLSAVRTLLARISRPPAIAPAFFQLSYAPASFPTAFALSRPGAAFTPSYGSAPIARPSATFLGLRQAFRQSNAARTPVGARPFASSAIVRGPRSYYGGPSRGRPGYDRSNNWQWQNERAPTWRDRLNSVPPMWVVGALIALNLAVFAAWKYGYELARRFRDISWLRFLQDNFTVSWHNFTQGRVWTLLTATFSHEMTGHILLNMLSLFFFAPGVITLLGNTGFFSLYIFAGVTASAISLFWNRLFNKESPNYAAHGASGAAYGIVSFFAALFPRDKFLLFFVLPVPAWLVVSGVFAYDLYGSMFRRNGISDSAGHVGGILAGLVFFLRKTRRI
ncbi:rhomboid family protein [Rhodotorula toruloides]|uniref:Rhomboid family protein n=1 Tax=Rhodotorula toruloides TaxID=5286 RepID=A0A511KCN6_RHOTO|nr:rhomboid family protein [Rhodotorula toruloides]